MNNVMTQYANPLFYGVGDVDAGLDKLKKCRRRGRPRRDHDRADQAGDAYLKART